MKNPLVVINCCCFKTFGERGNFVGEDVDKISARYYSNCHVYVGFKKLKPIKKGGIINEISRFNGFKQNDINS